MLEPRDRWQNKMERMQYKMDRMRNRMERRGFGGFGFGPPTSGNRAFDEYRSETLRRLEEEQVEFRNFLDRLRHAKDKEEFDQFMAQHKPRRPRRTTSRSRADRIAFSSEVGTGSREENASKVKRATARQAFSLRRDAPMMPDGDTTAHLRKQVGGLFCAPSMGALLRVQVPP